ncbi:lyase family protein [Mesosutterella porci]|uniref:lyase family protein n=1 Tax=Mesosutterella porci TaxID=2915351 RepID=UPI002DD651A8|nr:lyase family protein [Mesosutterella sp. oilRF-744-WT-GAM-9]
MRNSIDCVCSRDYLMEVMGALSIMANTIARMTTDMRVWSTPDFGYVEVSDSCAVCSSIMPQKKTPWTFETTAGLCARVKSDFDAVWMTYKGVPYAFTMESMDVIADFWPCVKDMTAILKLMDVTMAGVIDHRDRARSTTAANFCTVTELANTLVGLVSQQEGWTIIPPTNLWCGRQFLKGVHSGPLPGSRRVTRTMWAVSGRLLPERLEVVAEAATAAFRERMMRELEGVSPILKKSCRLLRRKSPNQSNLL